MPSIASLVAVACLLSAPNTTSSGLQPIRVGPILLAGYVQFDGLFPLGDHAPAEDGTFRIRRARIYASGDLLPKIGFMVNVDVADSPVTRDIYVTFRQLDAVNIKAGQFIAPYSLERLTSTRDLEAIERSISRFAPSRDMGVTVFNARPFWGQVRYSAAVINGTGQNALDNNDAKDFVGRVVWRLPRVSAVSIGFNAASGRQPTGMRTRWGVDVNVERGPYRVAAEYLHQTQDNWAGMPGHGLYLLARRRFGPAANRGDVGEAVVRVVEIRDPDEIVSGAPGVLRREIQAGGNYYVSPNVRVMADAFVPFKRPPGVPRATIVTRVQFMF